MAIPIICDAHHAAMSDQECIACRLKSECDRLQSLLQGTEQSILIIESLCPDAQTKTDLKRLREFMKDPTARCATPEELEDEARDLGIIV